MTIFRFFSIELIYDFLYFIVSKSLFRFYERLIDPRGEDFSRLVKLHSDAEGRFGTAWMERTEIIGEMLRKHRDNLVGGIYTRSAVVCFTVKCRSFCHILGNIGDMNCEFEVSVRELADRNGIIEILCVGSVDGYYPLISEVHSSRRYGFCLELLRLSEYIFWEFFHDSILVEYDTFCHAWTIFVTENSNHFSMRFILVTEN